MAHFPDGRAERRRKRRVRQGSAAPKFSDKIAKAIADSLPDPICRGRSELLPQILREWSRTALREHLSRESRATTQKRIKQLEAVAKYARRLLEGLKAVDKLGRTAIEAQMLCVEGRSLETVSRSEWADLTIRVNEELSFLARLAAIKPGEIWRPKPGYPPNIAAYLVLQDAAAIFEWFTGRKAARSVDRSYHTDTGPFWRFASILWPLEHFPIRLTIS
jgi:hypothetical protein